MSAEEAGIASEMQCNAFAMKVKANGPNGMGSIQIYLMHYLCTYSSSDSIDSLTSTPASEIFSFVRNKMKLRS